VNRRHAATRRVQRGVATLLVVLVLMMMLTLITLSVARVRISEQQSGINQQWRARLFMTAESALEDTLSRLDTLRGWTPDPATGGERYHGDSPWHVAGIETRLTLQRFPPPARLLTLDISARRADHSGLRVRIRQAVRQLTVLSPLAEAAPPLVLGGCPVSPPADLQVYPAHADSDRAGAALWLGRGAACTAPGNTDLHGGATASLAIEGDWHDALFTLDRDAYADLAEQERALPPALRRYWQVRSTDLPGGRWSLSVGSAERHTLLYFPAETGCPKFSDGVRIYGFVFIEAPCPGPIAANRLDIYGALVIRDRPALAGGHLRLAHLQTLRPEQPGYSFPVLRNIRVPGSWRDF